jgi:hypothetical protein
VGIVVYCWVYNAQRSWQSRCLCRPCWLQFLKEKNWWISGHRLAQQGYDMSFPYVSMPPWEFHIVLLCSIRLGSDCSSDQSPERIHENPIAQTFQATSFARSTLRFQPWRTSRRLRHVCWILLMWACHSHPFSHCTYSIGSMYAIYGNIYHQYTPNVSIYTIHGSYGYMYIHLLSKIYEIGWSWQSSHSSGTWLQYSATFFHLVAMNILWQHIGMGQSWAPNGTLTSVDYMFSTKSTK